MPLIWSDPSQEDVHEALRILGRDLHPDADLDFTPETRRAALCVIHHGVMHGVPLLATKALPDHAAAKALLVEALTAGAGDPPIGTGLLTLLEQMVPVLLQWLMGKIGSGQQP